MLWAALLAGIAGYVDAICYLRLGGAFAANMTGNLVEVGLAAAQGQWGDALWCASLLASFLFGVLAARLVLRTQHFGAAVIAAGGRDHPRGGDGRPRHRGGSGIGGLDGAAE